MKISNLIIFSCIISVFGLVIYFSLPTELQRQVSAQLTNCPPTYGLNNNAKWQKNSVVKLRLHIAFTDTERQIILSAFTEWNKKRLVNCSNVFFDTNNYEVADANVTSDSELTLTHWVEFNPSLTSGYKALTTITSRPHAETVIYGDIREPGTPSTNPDWLKGSMTHEIGHTLNLANATCTTSVMGIAAGNQYRVITENDTAAVRATYCPTEPTPTPIPIVPPYCPFPIPKPADGCPIGYFEHPLGYPLCCSGAPTPTPTPNPTPTPGGGNGHWECDPFCQSPFPQAKGLDNYSPDNVNSCCIWTPILIDIFGDGFALTDATGGVMFDFNGDGISNRISWTAGGTDDAWLVLDRDGNGLIDSSREMFGNMTEQPSAVNKNGFLALAEFDKAEKGGNGDGSINNEDNVFDDLRLWQDLNHNGISESSELFTLPALNVAEIELKYKESKKTDEFGNEFRYRAKVWDTKTKFKKSKNKVGRWAWDVFLKLEQPND